MNIFDFFTQDEIDDAPEDSALAFAYLVRIAQQRLSEATRGLDYRDDDAREMLESARHGFMNTVVSLGKSYGVEPFTSMEVPRYENFDYNVHRQFKADLDHYMAQLVIGNSIRGRRDSIRITAEAKERIRTHLHHIKDHIDKAGVPDAKKASLYAKLAEFEAALEKDRLSILAVGSIVLGILSVSANVITLSDSPTFQKLLSNVMVTVAEAKATDDENRKLPPFDPPPIMLPPRPPDPRPRPGASADLDDEIPF
jgi:hypothetical protein